jgi:hypothetical protein
MKTLVETPTANRADLMLIVLRTIGQNNEPTTRSLLEERLTQLVHNDQVGSFFQPYFRQALLHRAVVETLAFLETNGYIDSNLLVSFSGIERISDYADVSSHVDRVLAALQT